MIRFNKQRSYYINGITEIKDTNNPKTYMYVTESYDKEEKEVPIVICINKIIPSVKLFSKAYFGSVINIDTVKNRDGKNICVVTIDDIELDRTALMYEDYYENYKDNPDVWFSPF